MSTTYLLVMLIAAVALAIPSSADFHERPGYGHLPPAHSPKSEQEHKPPPHFGKPPIGQAKPPIPAHKHPHHKHPTEHKPFGPGSAVPAHPPKEGHHGHLPAHPPAEWHHGHFPAHPPKEGHHGHSPHRKTLPPHFIAPPPYY